MPTARHQPGDNYPADGAEPDREGLSSGTAASLLSRTRIASSLLVEPGEERRTALLFVLLFLASMVFVMGRTARDALFLTQFPVTWIAYMWVAYGVVSSLVALSYGRISASVSRKRLAIVFALGSAASYLAIRLAIHAGMAWAVVVFYVWAEIIANLFVIQAWAITNDLHTLRSGRRLFGLIGAGRVVGMLLSGFVTSGLIRTIGTANLIVVVAFIMVAYAALVQLIGSHYKLATPIKKTKLDNEQKPSLRQHKSYTALLVIMVLSAFVALTVGDYQFKAIAKITIPNTDDLAQYMAGFYTAVGAIAFVIQVFVTPRLLKHLGVTSALLAMPLAFLGSTAALLGWPILPVGTILKLSDNGIQFTIHDSAMQLLYFAYPPATRTRVRAILDAMAKPLGCSLGGVVLVL
ncbi:MAG: hypothetical protein FWD57_16665, partial [Polyangiaceae bacterium]|nr:hypothetical protein [Polyangiaceae bacterium]